MTPQHPAPVVRLSTWPTPLEPVPRLAVAVGLESDDLWIKRDDLIGLGGGGNKVRKLEWLCGAAIAQGADTLVTCGAAQSNHARLTAAAGARLGLDVVLVLGGRPGDSSDGNLALDGLLGARVRFAGSADLAAVADAEADLLRAAGRRPIVIPFGGSNAVGAQGYVQCAAELSAQATDLDHVVVALGSGGTMAGLVHALGPDRVLGVHCGAVADPAATVSALVGELADLPPSSAGLRIRNDQVGTGYADLTDRSLAAMTLAARTEGIVLDPIYTGRAMAGLISEVADGRIRPGQRTVFLHTGGLPGLFGHRATLDALATENHRDWPSFERLRSNESIR